MRIFLPFAFVSLVVTSALAQPQGRETVKVGPWTIATTYKGDKFDNCTMTNSAEGIGISFVRNADGLLLILNSPKWKLDRGKAYSVQLVTGSQTVEAKALAETKSVTIAITDRSFNAQLRAANVLRVRGEGATLRVPLHGTAADFSGLRPALTRTNGRARRPIPSSRLVGRLNVQGPDFPQSLGARRSPATRPGASPPTSPSCQSCCGTSSTAALGSPCKKTQLKRRNRG